MTKDGRKDVDRPNPDPDADEPAPKSRARRSRQRAARDQRRSTRAKLLRAGYQLLANQGKDAVSINDITTLAQVGFGSFYNHFDSKEALHDSLLDAFTDDIEVQLERRLHAVGDEAAVLALMVRYVIERAGRDRLWREFLLREAFAGSFKRRGVEARLIDVIHRGLASGRFGLLDRQVGAIATAAAVVGVVASVLGQTSPHHAKGSRRALTKIGRSTAATMLAGLGLEPDEARRVANHPRPVRGASVQQNDRSRSADRRLLFVRKRPRDAVTVPEDSR